MNRAVACRMRGLGFDPTSFFQMFFSIGSRMEPETINLRDLALPNLIDKKSYPCHLSKNLGVKKSPKAQLVKNWPGSCDLKSSLGLDDD